MNNKKIYYIFIAILISILFGCKNNRSTEAIDIDDVDFLKNPIIKSCTKNSIRANCSVSFNYKQKIINLRFVREYAPEKIALKHIIFLLHEENNKLFYQNKILNINSLNFNKNLTFENFNTVLSNLNIEYINDSNSIIIEFNINKKQDIFKILKDFLSESIEKTKNNSELNQKLNADLSSLNTIEPTNFTYENLKNLTFISKDLASFEKLILDIVTKHKTELIPIP